MDFGDIRILDLTRLLPGPYATQILGDMGADVIKVEDTNRGDYARDLAIAETSRLYESVNGGKRSVSIDLTTEAGTDAFYTLVEEADVVIEQFRPGVVDGLDVDYETLTKYNESLIYCSISGYGQSGPNSDLVGHDINYVGFSGMLDLNRPDEEEKPTLPGYPIGDMSGGLFAALNILHRLLLQADRDTPDSHYIDIAISDAVLSFSQMVGVSALDTECLPGETFLTGKYPCYNVYRTADDKFLTLAALEPKFWENLCVALERDDLVEHHLSEDPAIRDTVKTELAETFNERLLSEWEATFQGKDVPVGKTQSVTAAYSDPQTVARELLTPVDDTERVVTPGLQETITREALRTTPTQGEHTRSVLREAGYSESEIETLSDTNVIKES